MPQNSLTLCIDETGVYYRVPICLINEPISYDADYQAQKLKGKKEPESINMTLKVRNNKYGDIEIECTNLASIVDFKMMYIKKTGDDLDKSKLRMFAMGKELNDDLVKYIINEVLFYYHVKNREWMLSSIMYKFLIETCKLSASAVE